MYSLPYRPWGSLPTPISCALPFPQKLFISLKARCTLQGKFISFRQLLSGRIRNDCTNRKGRTSALGPAWARLCESEGFESGNQIVFKRDYRLYSVVWVCFKDYWNALEGWSSFLAYRFASEHRKNLTLACKKKKNATVYNVKGSVPLWGIICPRNDRIGNAKTFILYKNTLISKLKSS